MEINRRAIKVLNEILEAGFKGEKEVLVMTVDDILTLPTYP